MEVMDEFILGLLAGSILELHIGALASLPLWMQFILDHTER